jgi:hypothetical protein
VLCARKSLTLIVKDSCSPIPSNSVNEPPDDPNC